MKDDFCPVCAQIFYVFLKPKERFLPLWATKRARTKSYRIVRNCVMASCAWSANTTSGDQLPSLTYWPTSRMQARALKHRNQRERTAADEEANIVSPEDLQQPARSLRKVPRPLVYEGCSCPLQQKGCRFSRPCWQRTWHLFGRPRMTSTWMYTLGWLDTDRHWKDKRGRVICFFCQRHWRWCLGGFFVEAHEFWVIDFMCRILVY